MKFCLFLFLQLQMIKSFVYRNNGINKFLRRSKLFSTQQLQENTFRVPKKFKNFPFDYHQVLTVKIDNLTNLGFGVARVEVENREPNVNKSEGNAKFSDIAGSSASKWTIFVPNVIPGELVRIRVFRNFANYSEADLIEIIEPSDKRIEPKCELFGTCGGCQYQHMSIESQRTWKQQQVQELFAKIGKISDVLVNETLGTTQIYNYRSKLTPHYNSPKKVGDDEYEMGPIGFQQLNSRVLVDVPQCPIATETINSRLTEYREDLTNQARTGTIRRPKKGATLLLRENFEYEEHPYVETNHNNYVFTNVKGLKFRFMAGNFFQNNNFILPMMVDKVLEGATKGGQMTHLIDCYCGSGLFCLSCASDFEVCAGIEVNDKAIAEADENAKLNGITNCAFVAASAEAIFESNKDLAPYSKKEISNNQSLQVKDFPRDKTVVIIDPPRKGCSTEFLDQLFKFGPQRLVYMSCDPATQARDAKAIVAAGYSLESTQPFDLFPQTRHIECLCIFEKCHQL